MNYWLINTSGKANIFFANDCFGETIIKKFKDNVNLLANAISDKFLKKIVALNILSLAKIRKIMAQKSDATNQGNYYSMINNIVDVTKLVQLQVEECVFEKLVGQKCEIKTSELFALKTVEILTGILLHKYQMHIKGNQNKTSQDSDQANNEGNETDLDIDYKDM